MKSNILYSIVVPIYRVEKYLRQCVDSLICQTYSNIEIILVDDGSTDSCPAICDGYAKKDSRIKVIHKQNGGLVSARKAGALAASGEYILCVDADDWVSLDYIEAFNSVISRYNPDIAACGHICRGEAAETSCKISVSEGFYDINKIRRDIYPIAVENEYGELFQPTMWAKCFKKSLYLPEQLAVDDKIKIGEDGACLKPLLTKCRSLYVLPECLYFYRVNLSSLTKSKASYSFAGPMLIYKHLMQRIDITHFGFEAQICRRTCRELWQVVTSQFYRRESYKKIYKSIIKNISQSDYRHVLEKCEYKSLKLKLQMFLLKKHIIFPIYLLRKLCALLKP